MENHSIDIPLELTDSEKRERIGIKMGRIRIILLLLVFVGIAGFLWFGNRPITSAEENRDLATMPSFSLTSYIEGAFTENFAEWFNDSVPLRSIWKATISDFRSLFGLHFDGNVTLIGTIPTMDEMSLATEETIPISEEEDSTEENVLIATDTTLTFELETEEVTEEEIETETEEDVNGEIANNILIVNNRGIMLYGGSYATGQTYAETLNAYKEALGDEVKVYSLVAPTSVSFYLPEKYASYSASETANIENINLYLDGVISIDAISILDSHKSEAIYSRTDHHWQPLGAYYAAMAFAEVAGVDFADLSSYETVTKSGYIGTLYGYTGSADLKNNPEDFVYYIPSNSYTTTYYNIDMTNERTGKLLISLDNVATSSWYLVFMGGDERITHVETDCDNGRILVIIKDSYGNAIVPCLTGSFSEIWVVDMRYFSLNILDFIEEQGATDVLFCMNTFSATGSNAKKLITIMNQ